MKPKAGKVGKAKSSPQPPTHTAQPTSRASNIPGPSSASAPAKSKAIGPHNPLRQTLRALGNLAHAGEGGGGGDKAPGRTPARLIQPDKVGQIFKIKLKAL